MKGKLLITISCVFMVMALMALSGCRDIFHSKENLDYMDLVLDKEYSNSVKKGSRNYYKFHAVQDVTYYISWYLSPYGAKIKVASFWYDTGGTVTGEKEGWIEDLSFSSSRTGDVVVRITTNGSGSLETADYKFMVSTSKDKLAGRK